MWYSFVLMVGVIILVISFVLLGESLKFLKTSERAVGTVIQLVKVTDSENTDTFEPVFKYRTATHKEYTYQYPVSSNPASWYVGEEAIIAYPPDNPAKPRLLTYWGVFTWTVILMAISMPFIIIGAGYHLAQYALK